jgi:DNA-binding response OmpR family regulator
VGTEKQLRIELPSLRSVTAPCVLVVDDDPDLRDLVRIKLQTAGYEVVTANDGRDALAAVERRLPDLIVLDVAMPRVSGVEVCRQLRGTQRTESVPIIMLTARTQVTDEVEGLRAGADLYLAKPFSPRTLLSKVETLLTFA